MLTGTEAIASELMNFFLAGDHPVLPVLRAQYAAASIAKVTLSGTGFFIDWRVSPAATAAQPPNFQLGDIAFELASTSNGGGAVLVVREGYLTMLEAFLWTDEWPSSPSLTGVTYLSETPVVQPNGSTIYSLSPSSTRDLAAVTRAVAG